MCAICGRRITDEQIAARSYCQRVTGWSLPPGTHKGGSSIVGRKVISTDLAHIPCAQGKVQVAQGMWQ